MQPGSSQELAANLLILNDDPGQILSRMVRFEPARFTRRLVELIESGSGLDEDQAASQ
jgi:hypothetical protein